MTTLITGVTGGLGAAILENVAKTLPTNEIAVLVRSEEKGQAFKAVGYDVRIGDYSDEKVLADAFAGIETLMFVSGAPGQAVPRDEQHKNVVAAAKAAGVKNVVYTSITHADTSKAILALDHRVTEEALKASGLKVKILRNNWYVENELDTVRAALAGQDFVHAGGDKRVGWALRRDYGEAAARALTQPFEGYQVYELSGKAITYADFAEAVKDATGADFAVQSLTVDELKKGLEASGAPEGLVGFATLVQTTIAEGSLEIENSESDLETLLGHPQTDLVTVIKELLA